MANPYQAGQALGAALFGNTRDTYTDQLGRNYKVEQALQEARQARSKAVLGEQNVAKRQVIDNPDLLGRVLGGDLGARNEFLTAALLSNPEVSLKTLGEGQDAIMRQAVYDRATSGDLGGAGAASLGLTTKPLEMTKIAGDVAYNPYAQSDQTVNVTPLGEATIGQRRASAASSYASANNSNASAARTRQAAGIDAAKFGMERSGQWNPGGKSAGGTLGDSGKPLPVGALKDLLAVEDALGGTAVLNDIIQKNAARLADGTLKISPQNAALAWGRTGLGMATEGDVALNEWKSDLTKIVNESLRLNKGVQTEGDAQRAANELMSANDPRTAAAALARLAKFNRQAVELHTRKQDIINANYGRSGTPGVTPRDFGGTLGDPPSARGPGLPAAGASGVQRARNPRTGQVLVLINGQWVPE
ncbi:hypothetical protein JY454_01355 [Stenotrophomonas maltophilia]|nr:hypothetical protein [Stenotrophomonas maltophilia]